MPQHPHPLEYQAPDTTARARPRRFIAHACIAAVFCVALIVYQWRMRLWSSNVTQVHLLLSIYGLCMVIGCEWFAAGLSRRDRVVVGVCAVVAILSTAWCVIWPIVEPMY